MKKLDLTKDAIDFITALPPKQCAQVSRKTFSLLKNQHPNDCVKMHGNEDNFRVDIGEYRIIFCLEEDTVKIKVIGLRNDSDAYKQARNKK
jgi:mRNA interferase RelE/StbE